MIILLLGPIVSSLTRVSTQGGIIVIEGDNFGSIPSLLKVSFGGVPCSNLTFQKNHTSFSCYVAAGFGLSNLNMYLYYYLLINYFW